MLLHVFGEMTFLYHKLIYFYKRQKMLSNFSEEINRCSDALENTESNVSDNDFGHVYQSCQNTVISKTLKCCYRCCCEVAWL